jgi:phenylpropionate dioxygenase-like ring-hydroxylating dioxygenase large terminal subunit
VLRRTPVEKAPEPELGADVVPKTRYTSPEFMRLENERLWPRVWLLAGREADVAKPGDWFTFEIGPESILVVRDRQGRLGAFFNVCLHRGNRLCEPGMGHAKSFTCLYHCWVWGTDGRLAHVPDAETFPPGALPPNLTLRPLRCETWGGLVWVNMALDAEPLREFLGVVPEHLDPYRFEEQALVDDVTVEVDCNWKTSVDAFNEAYHIQGTHPELLEWSDDVNVQIDLYERHSRFIFRLGVISPRLRPRNAIPAPMRDILMRGAGIDPDAFSGTVQDVRPAIVRAMRELGVQAGIDYHSLHDDQLVDDFHYTIFPNVTFNIHSQGTWLFRHRPHPTDPEKMLFDFQTTVRLPAGTPPPPRPEHRQVKDGETSLGQILDQDLYNLSRVQAGMRSRAFVGLYLSDQERRIRHHHRWIERYLFGEAREKGR